MAKAKQTPKEEEAARDYCFVCSRRLPVGANPAEPCRHCPREDLLIALKKAILRMEAGNRAVDGNERGTPGQKSKPVGESSGQATPPS